MKTEHENKSTGEIASRLKHILKHYDLKQKDLVNRVELSNNTVISNILQGKTLNPTRIILEKILNAFPDVDARWFLTGKGQPFIEKEHTNPKTSDHLLLEAMRQYNTLSERYNNLVQKFEDVVHERDQLRIRN